MAMMKTGELRGLLAEALKKCMNGTMGVEEASSISKLAHQMTNNLRVEIRACESSLVMPVKIREIEHIGDLEMSA